MLGYPTPSPSRFPDKDSVSYLRERNRQFKLLVEPAKPGARSKRNPVGRKRRSRDEDEEEGDGEFVPEESIENGRVSDVDISSAGSEDDAFDSHDESEESDIDPHDEDLLFAAVEKSVHRKGYAWTMGAHYRVFWPTLGVWLVGQYNGPALRTGVTLWYESDDSVATHLYKDKWHITPYRATGPKEAE